MLYKLLSFSFSSAMLKYLHLESNFVVVMGLLKPWTAHRTNLGTRGLFKPWTAHPTALGTRGKTNFSLHITGK